MVWILSILLVLVSLLSLFLILKISSQVNERLNQMNNSLQEANKIIGQNMGSAASIFGNVKEQSGKLEETNRSIYDIGRDISRLQELLRAPKFRGQLGETMLEGIISQVLPKEYYQMQYRFKTSDTVDAVVHLGGKIIPIDAKFSLENFQKMIDAQDEPLKASFHKKFMQDIKNRVDEIAAKYILPQENTYDFGFMYIPAENVYYEIIVKEDILSYCISKKIIPISPNTFFAYLQVICLGLKGLKVEENAKEILKNLSTLSLEFARSKEDFNLLGSHLTNAARKYEDTLKRLEKFSDRLNNIQEQSA
ncbi:DNA recombination protein RmuC [bacterium]|nr:MAG: DNA recombination protein RmuC [bacterium]